MDLRGARGRCLDLTYIRIRNWQKFQHYKDRNPPWIKSYTELLADDHYRSLSMHQRGVLHSIWLAYATARSQLSDNTLTLTRQLGQRVLTRDLEALSDAGFLTFGASTPLAQRTRSRARSREADKERDKDNPPTPLSEKGETSSRQNGKKRREVKPQELIAAPKATHTCPAESCMVSFHSSEDLQTHVDMFHDELVESTP